MGTDGHGNNQGSFGSRNGHGQVWMGMFQKDVQGIDSSSIHPSSQEMSHWIQSMDINGYVKMFSF